MSAPSNLPVELSLASVFSKIDEALADLANAEAAEPCDAERYLKRAREHMHFAQTRARSTLARWREYDDDRRSQ